MKSIKNKALKDLFAQDSTECIQFSTPFYQSNNESVNDE